MEILLKKADGKLAAEPFEPEGRERVVSDFPQRDRLPPPRRDEPARFF